MTRTGYLTLLTLIFAGDCSKKEPVPSDDIPIRPTSPERSQPAGPPRASSLAIAPPAASASADSPPRPAPKGLDAYPLDAVKTIPDECSSAWTALTVVTPAIRESSPDWLWASAVQALYAHPEFEVVGGMPTAPMQVQIFEGKHGEKNFALWARCQDGATCNKLAAMYRAVNRTARPWVYCGAGDTKVDRDGSKVLFANQAALVQEARSKLESAVDSQCFRIGICHTREGAGGGEDIGYQCNRKPSTFKLSCAKKATCAEVVQCVGR